MNNAVWQDIFEGENGLPHVRADVKNQRVRLMGKNPDDIGKLVRAKRRSPSANDLKPSRMRSTLYQPF